MGTSSSSLELQYDVDSRQQVMLLISHEVLLCDILGRTHMAYAKADRTINTAGQLIVLPCVTLESNPEVPIRYP